MAGGFQLKQPGRAWLLLAALLGAGSLLAWWAPAQFLDWQPTRAASEPWRAWSAAFVHWSPLHLAANGAGLALVAALGQAARLPTAVALAWALAWPLTQFGLLARPELAHYGGLSGVLHAGVVVAAGWLLASARGRTRAIAGAVLAGVALKLVLEAPLGPALRHGGGWDIAVAPFAHLSGTLAGLLSGLLVLRVQRARRAA